MERRIRNFVRFFWWTRLLLSSLLGIIHEEELEGRAKD